MSARNHYIEQYLAELNKVCYNDGMVPLMCITIDTLGGYGIFTPGKYNHTQKAQILNTGLNVAIREYSGKDAPVLYIKTGTIDIKKQNNDTDDFLNECMKFCYAIDGIPVITILGNSVGKCTIFDNRKLSGEKKMETILSGMKSLQAGIRKELKAMKTARYMDLEKNTIYKA